MAIVLDASIAAAWALADEASSVAETAAMRLRTEIGWVPSLWWYEIRNLLVVNERRKRITVDDSEAFLRIIAAYPIQVDSVLDERLNLQVARQYALSFYDAAYLTVAIRNHAPLATLDRDLEVAAATAGVPVLR
ncbi:MAG TPA: type II toxin-antitoxin system VapC family toxin [Terracidiphilus sp.]|nr:type II toxin-antitoxin system VapC family toxin [Terracidiphilus sp.]